MVGRGGHPFEAFRFRTMGAAQVTDIGKLLRAWRIDELPLLLNVIRGEVVLVRRNRAK
jgi:lipopolysaccharide/colanic/teichoic acid biosynthesis glycosyltransferase